MTRFIFTTISARLVSPALDSIRACSRPAASHAGVHVHRGVRVNDPTYKSTLRRVWLWDEWSGRWGGDAGIDLVAEDHDGRLWAIQSKAYSPENAVTKADVDKFLSESSRSVFSYRLLIATTDKLHHVARRTVDDQEKQVAFVGLSDLLTSAVSWPTNPLDLRPSPPRSPLNRGNISTRRSAMS